ncbi:MAG: TetR/AcrR family transcriptional regulator [Acidimicrobiales bacterium]|nr:TetR/AcrR family transcriptional regulator [Acidimicrobiales bacterium]
MRPALTRAAIVEEARRSIIADGLEALSLRRIASALDVTAPALYAYVTDKGDLLRAVAEGELAGLIERFERVDEGDPVARVEAYCRAYIDHARANPELYPVMFIFPPDFAPGAPEGAEFPMASQAFAVSAAAVAEAIETGAFRPLDPLQASLVLFTAAHGAATVLLMPFGFDRATEDALIDATVETVLSGLQPR